MTRNLSTAISGILCLGLLFVGQGCLFVREEEEFFPPVELSPKPEVSMSDDIIRSKSGDMIAQIPSGWTFINHEGKSAHEIIAIAVNPEYTLSVVFSEIHFHGKADSLAASQDLYALIRAGIEKHISKSGNSVKQFGKANILNIGTRSLGYFEFGSKQMSLKTRAAVCTSTLGKFYELALVPLDVSGNQVPEESECAKIFRSIVATVQY